VRFGVCHGERSRGGVSLTAYQSRVSSYIYPIRPYDRSVVALVPVRRSRPIERGPVLLCPPFSVFPPLATVGFQSRGGRTDRRTILFALLQHVAGQSERENAYPERPDHVRCRRADALGGVVRGKGTKGRHPWLDGGIRKARPLYLV